MRPKVPFPHIDKAAEETAGYEPPSRPDGYEPMRTFDPTRGDVLVYDDLNKREFAWEPRWAKDYDPKASWDGDPDVNNFDGLLLTGWKLDRTRQS